MRTKHFILFQLVFLLLLASCHSDKKQKTAQSVKTIRVENIDNAEDIEVTKDKHRPFIVSSKDMNVAVLGTKFNFRSTQTDRIVEVSLLEGEVKASGTHEEGAITLSPGQKVELNKDTGKMKVMDTNAMLDAVWHSSMVKLQNASITQIAQLLEEVYDVKVILSPGVEKTSTYSGELKKKGTATDMLDALKHTLHIKYRKHKDIVFISPE